MTGRPSPFTTFYYPPKMFADARTTLNVLVTLEDAFIAAIRGQDRRGEAGFDTSKPYRFKPFTPHLPERLGTSTRSSVDRRRRKAFVLLGN
jgi:hypothetical protein